MGPGDPAAHAILHDLDSAPNLHASVGASLEMPSSPGPGGLGRRVASAAGRAAERAGAQFNDRSL
jgi:hypothetical protein